jgi:hypothetical protein
MKRRFVALSALYLLVITGLSFAKGIEAAIRTLDTENHNLKQTRAQDVQTMTSLQTNLEACMSQDQLVINRELRGDIDAIHQTFKETAQLYENLIELKPRLKSSIPLETKLAAIIYLLSEKNYSSASAALTQLKKEIKVHEAQVAAGANIPASVPVDNSPPGSGYARQQVETDIGTYMVSVVSADLSTTRVVVDTASGSDCGTNCPVLALKDYIARSNAFAGINGPYFCPAEYPSCAEKTNSFDTLIMNKEKIYFNSDNNVYSNVPAVIFSGSSARFVGKTAEWGRSTDVDSVIAAQPMLVSNGQVVFGGDGDPKKGSKGARGFIGATGSTVYIGHVHNATVAESARVLQALGVQNALNLDGGGSVALWANGGYKIGPGRHLPFGILLVRK